MTTYARDLMAAPLLTVAPETPLTDVNRMFVEDELHGAPVVGEDGRLLGFVSTADLLRAVAEEHEQPSAARSYFRETLEFSGPDWSSAPADFQDRLSRLCAADVMQTGVFSVPDTASVEEVAELLREARIHRVVVTRDEVPVGMISSFDLLALLAGASSPSVR